MQVHEDAIQLGWEGDEGFGDLLVDRLIAGSLTVLFEPIDLLDAADVADLRGSVGRDVTVFDSDEEPRCNVRVVEVFETTWGDPDPRLVAGDGYVDDVEAWRRSVAGSLRDALGATGHELGPDTTLIVQRVEVTEVAEDD